MAIATEHICFKTNNIFITLWSETKLLDIRITRRLRFLLYNKLKLNIMHN